MLTDNQKNALHVMEHGYPTLWHEATQVEFAAPKVRAVDVIDRGTASRIIGRILACVSHEAGGIWPWKYWTKQAVCAQALFLTGGDVDQAVTMLAPGLGEIKALRFQRNENGRRVDLSGEEQLAALRRQVLAVAPDVARILMGRTEPVPTIPEPEPEAEPEIPAEPEPIEVREQHPWLTFVREAREFFARRAADGHDLDEWGLRQAEYGALMLRAGIPIEALKHAATLHLPPEARIALSVRDFDVTGFRVEDREEDKHAASPYIMTLIRAQVPVALIGPKGTGKTTLAKQVARTVFGDDPAKFVLLSMTSATSPTAFYGRPKIGGDGSVVESQYSVIMRKGGLVLLDEMDAADENLLLIANSSIANGIFYNQLTAQTIHVHPDVIFMSAMNTMGLGADRRYKGRNGQDAAALDRWAMGRVQIGLDERIEDALFYGILNAA